MNLDYFKTLNFHPKSVLDIGCNVGEFYLMFKRNFPEVEHFMLIDANENLIPYLNKLSAEFKILTLSDEQKEVIWYETKTNPINTGNSYYLEKTIWYGKDKLQSRVKETTTLDDEFPDETFDLIKLDTQGSELDILKGGKELIQSAQYIICEVSLIEYNESAPLKQDVIDYLKEQGFVVCKTLETHRANVNGKDIILQEDLLFKNIGVDSKKFITPDMLEEEWL